MNLLGSMQIEQIPCRTAMQGGFPLNGTYFQTNEVSLFFLHCIGFHWTEKFFFFQVFADHETSLEPIVFSRELCNGLEKRALYCGSSVTSIFRMLDETRTRLCFWTGNKRCLVLSWNIWITIWWCDVQDLYAWEDLIESNELQKDSSADYTPHPMREEKSTWETDRFVSLLLVFSLVIKEVEKTLFK